MAERPTVEALEVDARPMILAGTAAWLVALVVLATVFRDDLQRHHATWWLWSCGIGAVIGLYGLYWASRHPPPADRDGP